MSGKAAGAESSDGIATMRMQLECGWLAQLSSGSEKLTKAAEYHIIRGSELAADLGLERNELADEVAAASRSTLQGGNNMGYLRERLFVCRGLRPAT
jgi:hypothetical protein